MKTPSYYRGGKKMKKFKVLRVVGNSIYSPLQNYYYGEIKEVIGKKFICDDFSKNEKECDKGFYATDIDGLIYCMNNSKSNRIFEVEVGGRSKVFNEYKQRYEEQTIVRMLSENEVRQLIREQSDKMDWDYYHACYPVNPLELDIPFNKDKALKLLKEWASAWDSVRASAWASVGDSVWDSVGDSVWAYISSLFPNIKKWKYIEHKEGVNPFQSSIDLWHMGLVPSFDGEVWRLHKGEKAEVVLEITRGELREVKE
jgi:hypothetical protein